MADEDYIPEIEDEEAEEFEGEPAEGLDAEEFEESFNENANAEDSFNLQDDQLSDEELDAIADTALEAINRLLPWFGISNATIEEYEGDEGELIFDIIGDNLAILIGRHGRTLDAFQFIISSIVTKNMGFRYPISVDVEGYKHRRRQKLVTIAKSSAARAIRQKRPVSLRPMTPYERRIIHITLRSDSRITTASEGTEPNRMVVITPR